MKKQVVVIGLGRFGIGLAKSLSNSGHDVLALDVNEQKIQEAASQITHVVHADATSETALSELEVGNFDVAAVAIGSDIQSSVLSTILVKKLGVPHIIARANNALHGEILSKIGADKVVFPEADTGDRVAHGVRLGNVLDYLSVVEGYGIVSVGAPAEFDGRTLAELGFGPKGKEHIAVLLIKRGNDIIVTPSLTEHIRSDDILVIGGRDDSLEAFLANRK